MLTEFNHLSEDSCLDIRERDFGNILIIGILWVKE
jgi:hypothetical protein